MLNKVKINISQSKVSTIVHVALLIRNSHAIEKH